MKGRHKMKTKLSLSIAAALAISAAAAGIARADPTDYGADEARASDVQSRSPTNDEINALETGVPASVDYRNRKVTRDGNWKSDWQSLEDGNPHSSQPGNRAVPEPKK